LITVDPSHAPPVGALTASAGLNDPYDQWVPWGAVVVVPQVALTETSNVEDVAVNAIKLTAYGSGDDHKDIKEIDLVLDVNGDGIVDTTKGDVPLGLYMGGYPSDDGQLTLKISGDSTFRIAKGATANLLVVYHLFPFTMFFKDYWLSVDGFMATGCDSHLQCAVSNSYALSHTLSIGFEFGSGFRLGVLKLLPDGIVVRRWHEDYGLAPSGSGGQLENLVITDCTTGFYVQEPDGSAGMRLLFEGDPPEGAAVGKRLLVEGVSYTDQFERVIAVSSAEVSTDGPQRVVAMPIRSVGGGDWHWDIITHAGQRGVAGGIGLNNIGLLVKTWGKYTKVDDTAFTLDDGSGTPLRCEVPSTVTLQEGWTYVVATGVSSMDMIDGQPTRVLRLRMQDDVQSIL